MKFLWVILLAFLRPAYFIYSTLCLLIPAFTLYAIAFAINGLGVHINFPSIDASVAFLAKLLLWIYVVLAVVIPIVVYSRKSQGNPELGTDPDPNPFQSAFMSWFASLRFYWNTSSDGVVRMGLPSGYLVENPMSYQIAARDMREILGKLQPGDILVRGYDGYVDGACIRLSSRCSSTGYKPGWFTHVAMYVGELGEADRHEVPAEYQHNQTYFQEGPQMVLHSMAMGVHSEDILTWFRCDYMAVLRLKPDFANRDAAIVDAKSRALQKVGEPYDFECTQTDKFNRFSCSEFVYFCYRNISERLGLSAQLHALYPLGKLNPSWSILGRVTVTPDDYYDLASEGHLDVVWMDERSKKRKKG